jgi:hypothetical protein
MALKRFLLTFSLPLVDFNLDLSGFFGFQLYFSWLLVGFQSAFIWLLVGF